VIIKKLKCKQISVDFSYSDGQDLGGFNPKSFINSAQFTGSDMHQACVDMYPNPTPFFADFKYCDHALLFLSFLIADLDNFGGILFLCGIGFSVFAS
jgi:hypothetical protein